MCVGPYPTEFVEERAQASALDLVEDRVQNVDLDIPQGPGAKDLLFVDSTHTGKPGSNVNHLVLEILPRLAKGTYVHFHDILFPYDYSPGILEDDLFSWGRRCCSSLS